MNINRIQTNSAGLQEILLIPELFTNICKYLQPNDYASLVSTNKTINITKNNFSKEYLESYKKLQIQLYINQYKNIRIVLMQTAQKGNSNMVSALLECNRSSEIPSDDLG